MKQRVTKLSFLALWVALLAAALFPTSLPHSQAAPLAAITGTPTEQPTRTPTSTPGGSQPTPTAIPRKGEPGIADPFITKSVNVAEARIGDEIVFTLTVGNRGTDTAEDVVVTDPIPDYLDVIEASTTRGNVSSSGRTVIVDIGRVAPGDEVSIRIRVRVNERAQPPEGRNGVTVSTSSPGDDPGNNTSQVTFRIVVDATATPAPAEPQPAPAPQPTPATPTRLPRTAGDEGNLAALLGLGGLFALGASLLIRRAARR